MINWLTIFWYKYISTSPPDTMKPGGFERYVKWCAVRLENRMIETTGHIDHPTESSDQ